MSAATPLGRGSTCLIAAAPGRVALAAALTAALLLSPGARDACAGCCRDEAPAVAAPLAAGVAPVHCCHAPQKPAGCCDVPAEPGPAPGPVAGPVGCECQLHPHDTPPAAPRRGGMGKRNLDDSPALVPAATLFRAEIGADEPVPAVTAGTVPGRPVRILYGVWRN